MPRLILGHTTHSSIKIWVRGSERWPVAFIDVLDSADRRTASTHVIDLDADDFYTGVVTWTDLSSDRPYRVKVAFGKTVDAPEWERVRDAYTEGNFHTFPLPDNSGEFTFLLGSCNLHSLGLILNPDEAWARISHVAQSTNARFMIHCGDQIYADIPLHPNPDPEHYRSKYLDAWEDCRTAQRFLTELPQYMILDDHEITNNFDRDMNGTHQDFDSLLRTAMKVYYEFQHKHNPDTSQSPRHYHYMFNYGSIQFFVMDTRYWRQSQSGEMISSAQLDTLKSWLSEYADSVKFIITSVPFVGEVKTPKRDKWCDPVYQNQRLSILEHIWNNNIEKIIFLVGDMHTSYHAQLKISKDDRAIIVHELMSSPVNQYTPDLELDDLYHSPYEKRFDNGLTIRSLITRSSFYGNHSNVMAIGVNGNEIRYRIYRTRADGGPAKSRSFSL